MKKLLLSKYLLLTLLLLLSTSALAHTGHLANESAHGFLHVEHIIMLVAVGLVVYIVKVLSNK
jgi:hydrogenase/urease accessory protein HupE